MKKQKKDGTLLLRINKEKKEKLKHYAHKHNLSVNKIIDNAIDILLINDKETIIKDTTI